MESNDNEFQGMEDHELLAFIADRVKDEPTARRAWEELYRRRMAGLEETCLRFVRRRLVRVAGMVPLPEDVAHDLATDAMLDVWMGLAAQFTAQPKSGTSSIAVAFWLSQIARNLWLNWLRSVRRKERNAAHAVELATPEEDLLFSDDGSFEVIDHATTAEDLLHRSQLQEAVRSALERLPERQRLILRTAVECDVAFGSGGRGDADAAREMAMRLDMPIGSARQAKNRALQALRDLTTTQTLPRRSHEKPGQDTSRARLANDRSAE